MSTVEGTAGGVLQERNQPTVLGLRNEADEAAAVSPKRQLDLPKPDMFLLYKITFDPPNSLPTKVF
jgi:hypothetical protein